MEKTAGIERRRGARINSKFWVNIPNIVQKTELRQGNISISGIYLEIDAPVGKAGDVHSLNLATLDRSAKLVLMARLVRVLTIDDIWRGKVRTGAAWEFLFNNDEQRRSIERFVRRVAELQKKDAGNLKVAYQYKAQVDHSSSSRQSALVTSVWLNGMLIETDWPVQHGEQLNVEIEAPASKKKMRLVGQAINTKELRGDDVGRYQVEIKFVGPELQAACPGGVTIADAVDQLLSEAAVWSSDMPGSSHEHLKGSLSQIRLPSLLAFLELERMSGVLRLEQDNQVSKLYIQSGRVVDAVTNSDVIPSALEVVSTAMQFDNGAFEFRVEQVDRPDTIGMSISALLIEMARREDESRSFG